jgi:2-dehydro-3-deoxygluconokinase
MSEEEMCDVLTFGETMLRFSPPGYQRLAQSSAFEVWTAGSESNVAAALRVLGRSVTWVSRLPDNPLGHKIEAALCARDIGVSSIVWTPATERVGLFYAEPAAEPRAATVVYDRAHSAASFLSPSDLPDMLFDSHRHLHVSGITPALSPSCAETVADAICRAKLRGRTVSLDVNYRARLWPPEAAAAALSPLIAQADILFCARDDAERLFEITGDDTTRAMGLQAKFGNPVVALTAGSDGAVGCDAGGGCILPAVPVAASVERFGSGDAFAAGFLSEYLAGATLEQSLRLAVAVAALKRTIPGDMLIATRAEIDAVLVREVRAAWR